MAGWRHGSKHIQTSGRPLPVREAILFSSKRMKPFQSSSSSWLTGYSASFPCAVASVLGLTGYYSDLLRRLVPDWVAVGLFIAPIGIVLSIQWGEVPDRIVAAAHTIAASWFMILALGMEVGLLLGYQPRDSGLFRVLAHVGWTFAWAGVYRQARAYSHQKAEQRAALNGGPSLAIRLSQRAASVS